MALDPDRHRPAEAVGPGPRPVFRAAPTLFCVAMFAVILVNIAAFVHYQSPATVVEFPGAPYYPLRLRSEGLVRPIMRNEPPYCYYRVGELLAGRRVIVHAGGMFPLWHWRYVGLADVEMDHRPALLWPSLERELRHGRGVTWRCKSMKVHFPVALRSDGGLLHALATSGNPGEFFLVEASKLPPVSIPSRPH